MQSFKCVPSWLTQEDTYELGVDTGGGYVCPVAWCSKSFTRASDLRRHEASHDPGAKRYDCDAPGCSGSFLRKDKLIAHRNKRHTKTDPPVAQALRIADTQSKTLNLNAVTRDHDTHAKRSISPMSNLNVTPTSIRSTIAGLTGEDNVPLRFACPFFKKDPATYSNAFYRSCPGPGWNSVHRLKAHLYRRHTGQPCPRCKEPFNSPQALSDHLSASIRCPIRNEGMARAISAKQEQQLKKRRRLDGDEQSKWREVYKILFPEDEPSAYPSPYYHQAEQAWQPGSLELTHFDPRSARSEWAHLIRAKVEETLAAQRSAISPAVKSQLTEDLSDAMSDLFISFQRRHPEAVRVSDGSWAVPFSSTALKHGDRDATLIDIENRNLRMNLHPWTPLELGRTEVSAFYDLVDAWPDLGGSNPLHKHTSTMSEVQSTTWESSTTASHIPDPGSTSSNVVTGLDIDTENMSHID